jgi:hypothetical protein
MQPENIRTFEIAGYIKAPEGALMLFNECIRNEK